MVFTCPSHFCQVCHVSGDAMKMMRCWRCPQAYHSRCASLSAEVHSSGRLACLTGDPSSLLPTTAILDVPSFDSMHGAPVLLLFSKACCGRDGDLEQWCKCRCLPKAARRLNIKNIECEACGLVRAGRAQAMASLSFPADTAAAMLHVPATVPTAGAVVPSASTPAPQIPLSAAHQISPAVGVTPTLAVGHMPEGRRGGAPLVATLSGRPASYAGGPQSQLGEQADGSSAQGSQQEPQTPSLSAIKSYSPADILTRKLPAVAACGDGPDVHIQAIKGAWKMSVVVNGDDPAPAQHAEVHANADSNCEEMSSPDSVQELSSRETTPRCAAYGCTTLHICAHVCTPQEKLQDGLCLHRLLRL